MSTQPINYYSTLNYFSKQGFTIIEWVDTIVFNLWLSQEEKQLLHEFSYVYPINSHQQLFTLEQFPWLTFTISFTHRNYPVRSLSLDISIHHDELTLSAMQIYLDHRVSRLTLYGLYFRFCELANIDHFLIFPILLQYVYDQCGVVNNNQLFHNIYRLDYKYDIFGITPKQFYHELEKFNRGSLSQRNSYTYAKKWEIETIYIWQLKGLYHKTRIYNKDADTQKKWKQVYYFDYPDTVTRLEFEYKPHFIGDLTTQEIITKHKHHIWSFEKTSHVRSSPYFVGQRYDENIIINKEIFLKRLHNSTMKALKNSIDLTGIFNEINREQSIYTLTCTKNGK